MNKEKISYILLIVVLLFVAIVSIKIFDKRNDVKDSPISESSVTDIPQAKSLEARWLLAGEVFWGRNMQRIAESKPDAKSYLFSKLDTFNPEQYDAWLAQLECPVTEKEVSFETQANALIFNCKPEYLPEFSKWFDVVALANNHMDNVDGVDGLYQTRDNLDEVGVQYYGHFDNSITSDICEVVSLPIRLTNDDTKIDSATLPVAMCGYHGVFRLPTDTELSVIKEYSDIFLTIVSPQQGAEYKAKADLLKQQTYRKMIDYGADLVVASHPHWVQDTEVYNGKLIMYSVGNFMFDQEWSEEVKRGAALDLRLKTVYDTNLKSWIELGKQCQMFKDDCLLQARTLQLSKPKFDLSYNLVSSFHQDGLTQLAPENIHLLNLERTNWAKTLVELAQ